MITTKQQDQAILRISYLLASLDGTVSDDEKKLFRKVAGTYSWFTPGERDANVLLDQLISASEKLIRLKGFYNEQEFLTAFLDEVKNDCDLLKTNHAVARQGFAIWIAMCMADKDFSPIERAAIRLLQANFNGQKSDIAKCTDALLCIIPYPLFFPGNSIKRSFLPCDDESNTSFINDEFLKKTEELCLTLGTIMEKIEVAKNQNEKMKLENAYHLFESELHELIMKEDAPQKNHLVSLINNA